MAPALPNWNQQFELPGVFPGFNSSFPVISNSTSGFALLLYLSIQHWLKRQYPVGAGTSLPSNVWFFLISSQLFLHVFREEMLPGLEYYHLKFSIFGHEYSICPLGTGAPVMMLIASPGFKTPLYSPLV
ncbi:MAG: hypothetical protein Ct9H300mP28_36250 [Pseudomonadota bacterium]|nr:MAG: hypothetical protein Ct9H300mP28_36250 [Pseudomonadota bacterium]